MWVVRIKYSYSNRLGQTMLYGPFDKKSDAAQFASKHEKQAECIWLEYLNPIKE
jgi:hypothetical protein